MIMNFELPREFQMRSLNVAQLRSLNVGHRGKIFCIRHLLYSYFVLQANIRVWKI